MLVKVTNDCEMGCSHCMEDSRPKTGQHMTLEVFAKTLDLIRRLETEARRRVNYRVVLLSGGEPTDNPNIIKMMEMVCEHDLGLVPWLLTHGMWMADPARRKELMRREWKHTCYQVTNDPFFYPKDVMGSNYTSEERVASMNIALQDPRIVAIGKVTMIFPIGRAATNSRVLRNSPAPPRTIPTSFNFRELTRRTGDVREAIGIYRQNAVTGGLSGHCAPSVTHEGKLVAGESRFCWEVGTVDSSSAEITANVIAMGSCNRCGLEDRLDDRFRKIIGLPPKEVANDEH